MSYFDYDDNYNKNVVNNRKSRKNKLAKNQCFSREVFEGIFNQRRKYLKFDALKISKIIEKEEYSNFSTNEKVNKAVNLYGGLGMFFTVAEKTFFELHIIFKGDTEFGKVLKENNYDYDKVAKIYNTTPANVKMRNLIRLINYKEQIEKNNEQEDIDTFVKKLV